MKLKRGTEKNPERLPVHAGEGMESLLFKHLRSDSITRKALDEAGEVRKTEDTNTADDIGNLLLRKKRPLIKRFHDGGLDEGEPEKSRKTLSGSFEDLNPMSDATLSFVQNEIYSALRTNKRNKLNLEKELEIFSHKYEETVGNEILCRLPRNGVLEDALNAIRNIQEPRQTDAKNIFEEFQEDDAQFSEEFKFSTLEPEKPVAEGFIKNFSFCDNLHVSQTDYYNKTFTGNSFECEIHMLDDELKNYYRSSFQPSLGHDDEDFYVFPSQEKNVESSDKNLSIASPPIQFYRRNMF